MALICCALRGPRFTGSGPPPSVQRTGLLSGWEEAALWWEKINPPLTSGRTLATGDASGTFAGRWEGEKGRVQFASSRSASVGWGKRMRALLLMHLFIFFSQATNRKSKAVKKKECHYSQIVFKKETLGVWQDTFSSSLSFTGGCRASSILHRKDHHHHHHSVSLGNCRCISLATFLHHSCLWIPSSEVTETRSSECCIQRHSGLTWKVSLFQKTTDWNRYEIWIGVGGMKERSVRESRQVNKTWWDMTHFPGQRPMASSERGQAALGRKRGAEV